MAAPLDRYIHWLRDNGARFDKFDFKTGKAITVLADRVLMALYRPGWHGWCLCKPTGGRE